MPATGWRRRLCGIALQPLRHIVVVELLRPDQPGEGLTLHGTCIGILQPGLYARVEAVGLCLALFENRVEVAERQRHRLPAQPQPHLDAALRRHAELVPGRALRAGARRIHRAPVATDHALVKAVLAVAGLFDAIEAAHIGVVVGEQQLGLTIDVQAVGAELGVLGKHLVLVRMPESRTRAVFLPAPGVPEPQLRQDVQGCRLGAAIDRCDAHQDVFRRCLCVLDEHIEVAVAVEHARIQQFVLGL